MSDEIKTIHVHMKGPSRSKPGGVSVIGHYRVEDVFGLLVDSLLFALSLALLVLLLTPNRSSWRRASACFAGLLLAVLDDRYD